MEVNKIVRCKAKKIELSKAEGKLFKREQRDVLYILF